MHGQEPSLRRQCLLGLSMLGLAMVAPMFLHAADGDAQRGRTIYEMNCLLCHGTEGKGDGQFGKVTSSAGRRFHQCGEQEKVRCRPAGHHPKWPPADGDGGMDGTIIGQRVQDVLAYVKNLRG